jgi:hypothetical protein
LTGCICSFQCVRRKHSDLIRLSSVIDRLWP